MSVVCNDWKHEICQERVQFETKVNLACQLKKPYTYPLSRGYPCLVPSMKYLLNEHLFDDERITHRVKLPWLGFQAYKSENDLKIMAVNAVGDIYESTLINENTDPKDTTIYCDETQNFDESQDFQLPEQITLPVDSHRLEWLKFKYLTLGDKEILNRSR